MVLKILPPSVLADTVGRRTIRTHVLVRQLETIKLEMRKELSYSTSSNYVFLSEKTYRVFLNKRYFSNFHLISVLEVEFCFFTCVLESEC